MSLAFILPTMACVSNLFNYCSLLSLFNLLLHVRFFLHDFLLKMSMCSETGLRCSFQF